MIKTLVTGILWAVAALAPLRAAPKSITLNAASYPAGSPITATFTGGPGNNNDWIGIFPASITQPSTGTYLDWLYTNGTQTPGGNLKSGSVTFANPTLAPGNYKVWFLAANGYTKIAGPAQFSVTIGAKGSRGFGAGCAGIPACSPPSLCKGAASSVVLSITLAACISRGERFVNRGAAIQRIWSRKPASFTVRFFRSNWRTKSSFQSARGTPDFHFAC